MTPFVARVASGPDGATRGGQVGGVCLLEARGGVREADSCLGRVFQDPLGNGGESWPRGPCAHTRLASTGFFSRLSVFN